MVSLKLVEASINVQCASRQAFRKAQSGLLMAATKFAAF